MADSPANSTAAQWASMIKKMQTQFDHPLNYHGFKNNAFHGMVDARTPVTETLDILIDSKRLTDFEKCQYDLRALREAMVKLEGMSEKALNGMSEQEFMDETRVVTMGAMTLLTDGTVRAEDGTISVDGGETGEGSGR